MISKFKFRFSAGQINNQYMTLAIMVDGQFNMPVEVKDNFTAEVNISLPATIQFCLDNKNKNDTIVKDNKVVADKFIKLDNLEIDGFYIEPWQIPNEFFYFNTNENTTLFTDYWGKNGISNLIINEDDPALWLLECPKII